MAKFPLVILISIPTLLFLKRSILLNNLHNFEFINVNDGLSDADGNLRKDLTFDGCHMYPACV
jgi:hypothetical protein